jgi:hypothetical protein
VAFLLVTAFFDGPAVSPCFFSNRLGIKNLNLAAVEKFPFTPYLCPRLFFPAEPG